MVAAGVMAFALEAREVGSQHVKAHSGDPWNEMADVVCNVTSERGGGFDDTLLPNGLHAVICDNPKACEWLHFSVASDTALAQYPPCSAEGVMDLHRNVKDGWLALPAATVCSFIDGVEGDPVDAIAAPDFVPPSDGILAFSINVQSLRDPKQKKPKFRREVRGVVRETAEDREAPWSAKRNVVLEQLSSRKVHVCGMQEARPWFSGISVTRDHILIAARAYARGSHGLLLAFSRSLSWGTVDGVDQFISVKHIEVVVSSTRMRIVRVRTDYLDFAASVIYAPRDVSTDTTPDAYWLQATRDYKLAVGRPNIFFADANTSANAQVPGHVGRVTCGERIHSGFVDFLSSTGCWLPCTFFFRGMAAWRLR